MNKALVTPTPALFHQVQGGISKLIMFVVL